MRAISRVLLAAVLGFAACAEAACADRAAAPAPSPAATTDSSFGGTDLAWIEINIAMDEELLPLLELVPDRSGSPELQALAVQVRAFTQAELGSLRQLHDRAGLPPVNPHEGMPMPGMVTPQQVAEAAKQTGKTFDATVDKAIKAHLTQGVSLAKSEEKSGVEPQTRELALQILRTRESAMPSAKSAN